MKLKVIWLHSRKWRVELGEVYTGYVYADSAEQAIRLARRLFAKNY